MLLWPHPGLRGATAPGPAPSSREEWDDAQGRGRGEPAEREESAAREQPGDHQLFVTYRHVDLRTGLEAFRLLIPKGWQVEGAIAWSANPALPATSDFRIHSQGGSEELRLFPTQSYFWTDNPLFLATNPPGSLRFGTLVAQPIDLDGAFRQLILPRFRPGVADLQIVGRERVPELAALAAGTATPGVDARAEGGKIRLTYREAGAAREEEIYAAVSQFRTDLPGSAISRPYFINYWFVDYVFSFRARKGQLDAFARTFQTMIFSLRVNPQWFAKVLNVKEALVQLAIREIHAVGRMGEIIARAGSQIREDQQRAWEQRQQVQDKIAQNFGDHIRGVERYTDPFSGKEVELPSGYGHAWANNLGEYVVTDNPDYNPNVGSNLHWNELPRAP